jgi:hypothetical protein
MRNDMVPGNAQDPDEVAGFLLALRALGEGTPPEPGPQLAALLGGAVPMRSHHHRRRVLRGAGVAAALVAALVGAAANHSLPQPAQRVVSNLIDNLTPFHIGPGSTPQVPTPSETPEPEPGRTRTGEPPGRPNESDGSAGDDDAPTPRTTEPSTERTTEPSTERSSEPSSEAEGGGGGPQPSGSAQSQSQGQREPIESGDASAPTSPDN